MKAGLSLNVFWQGTSKPLLRTMCRPQLFHVQDPLDCTLHLFGLTFFLEILVSRCKMRRYIQRTRGLGTQGPGDPGTRGPRDPDPNWHTLYVHMHSTYSTYNYGTCVSSRLTGMHYGTD